MSKTNNPDFDAEEVKYFKELMRKRLAEDDRLTEQEKQIVRFRVGLEDGQVKTSVETAAKFGITPLRVRQIEGKALRKDGTKGDALRRKKLKHYLD